MVDPDQRSKAIHKMSGVDSKIQIVIVLMGGDGGLTRSLASLISEKGINVDNLQFVTLPFGSGNDAA